MSQKIILVFSAAHFITIGDNICERLHGHNYRVAAEVSGPLDKHQCVIDFIAASRHIARNRSIPRPSRSAANQASADSRRRRRKNVEATFEDRRWSISARRLHSAPVANTTAEKLAEYIGRRLLDELQRRKLARRSGCSVEVDECYGQIGICELTPD